MNITDTLNAVATTANLIDTPAARRIHDSARLLTWHTPGAITILQAEIAAAAWPAMTGLNGNPAAHSTSPAKPTERAALTRLGHEDRDTDRQRWTGRAGPTDELAELHRYTVTALHAILTAHNHWQTAHATHALGDWARIPAILDALDLVDDWTHNTTTALREAHNICTRHTPDRDPRTPWRCIGTGDQDGATCHNIYDYRIQTGGTIDHMDRRCTTCRNAIQQRKDRARHEAEAARKARWSRRARTRRRT